MDIYKSDNGETTVCEWFALCDNQTDTAIITPGLESLGPVPICERCLEKLAALA